MQNNRVGFNVRRLRVRQLMSQERLAKLSGIERAYLSRLERGVEKNPTLTTLQRLADTLGVDVADLLAERRGRVLPKTLVPGRPKR